MGKTPMMIADAAFSNRRKRPIFVSSTELYNWCVEKYNEGDEDPLTQWGKAMEEIASIFDGSLTYTNPFTKETFNLPELLTEDDVEDLFNNDFNARIVSYPLFTRMEAYYPDNDNRWQVVLDRFCGRIHRFVKAKGPTYYNMIGSLYIINLEEFNPIADFWEKEKEFTGSAPYASFDGTETDTEDVKISSWTTSNGKASYKSESDAKAGGIETKNYSTTYDDASNDRLASRQVQTGGSESSSEIPNSAAWRKKETEGNKGSFSPSEMIEKQLELSKNWSKIKDEFFNELAKEIFLSIYNLA